MSKPAMLLQEQGHTKLKKGLAYEKKKKVSEEKGGGNFCFVLSDASIDFALSFSWMLNTCKCLVCFGLFVAKLFVV